MTEITNAWNWRIKNASDECSTIEKHTTFPEFAIRRATVADTRHISALFKMEYGNSSHPCLDERYVDNAIASKSEVWLVAEENAEAVIGCLSVSYNAHNRSWEFGRGMISQHYRKRGVVSSLMQSIIETMPIAAHDLTFVVARNNAALQAMQNHVDAIVVGHDGAPNMVHGVREHHAVTIGKFRSKWQPHYLPLSHVFRESEFLREQLFEPLGLESAPGKYPATYFWGSGDTSSDRFTFRLDERVNALYLCQHTGGPHALVDEVVADLQRLLNRYHTARHVGAIVLADKITLIKAMLERGFDITAYLPAWHWHQGARYDCVLLSLRKYAFANKNGLDAYIDSLDAAYQEIGQRILVA